MNTDIQPMDQYDPENFDWGDETSTLLDLDTVHPEVIEMFTAAVLAQHLEDFSWNWSTKSNIRERAKKIFRHKIIVTNEDDKEWIRMEWPEYHHDFEHGRVHHDHPISHIANELNELEMVYDLALQGKGTFIDLFGNSGRDAKYRRNCINLYTRATGKDYMRYQYPGMRDEVYDLDKLCDPDSVLGAINDITCTHAMYYLSMPTIGRIVNTSGKRRLRTLVHRHPLSSGTLNRGELEYVVSEDGQVVQRNVLTGEKYTHASLEALFHQDTARTQYGGVTWTTRKAGGDSFFIDFVGCPTDLCKEFVPLHELAPETRTVVETTGVTVKSFLHWTWTVYSKGSSDVTLWDVDLLTKLRRYVSGKSRTPRLQAELCNLARRLTNKADIISIHGGGAHMVDVAGLMDYVLAAFYMDVHHELEISIAFAKKNAVMVDALNSYYDSGVVPRDLVAFTKTLKVTSNVATWSAHAVGGVINAALTGTSLNGPVYSNPIGDFQWLWKNA